jgi:hypothetical protein
MLDHHLKEIFHAIVHFVIHTFNEERKKRMEREEEERKLVLIKERGKKLRTDTRAELRRSVCAMHEVEKLWHTAYTYHNVGDIVIYPRIKACRRASAFRAIRLMATHAAYQILYISAVADGATMKYTEQEDEIYVEYKSEGRRACIQVAKETRSYNGWYNSWLHMSGDDEESFPTHVCHSMDFYIEKRAGCHADKVQSDFLSRSMLYLTAFGKCEDEERFLITLCDEEDDHAIAMEHVEYISDVFNWL